MNQLAFHKRKMEENTPPTLKEERNVRKKHIWKCTVEESVITEKKKNGGQLPAMVDYLRLIATRNKLQRCDKIENNNNKKTHLFEDIGNSQRRQTSQGQEFREQRKSLRSTRHSIPLNSLGHLLIRTQHTWKGCEAKQKATAKR